MILYFGTSDSENGNKFVTYSNVLYHTAQQKLAISACFKCSKCKCTQGTSESTFASLMVRQIVSVPNAWYKAALQNFSRGNAFKYGTCIYCHDWSNNQPIHNIHKFTIHNIHNYCKQVILIHTIIIHYDMQTFLFLIYIHNNTILHCKPFILMRSCLQAHITNAPLKYLNQK